MSFDCYWLVGKITLQKGIQYSLSKSSEQKMCSSDRKTIECCRIHDVECCHLSYHVLGICIRPMYGSDTIYEIECKYDNALHEIL